MIVLIGSGYIGSEFAREMDRRDISFLQIHHTAVDTFEKAHHFLYGRRPTLVINCAAFIPPESVSLCDKHPEKTITGNVLFPATVAAREETRDRHGGQGRRCDPEVRR